MMRRESDELFLCIAGDRVGQRAGDRSVPLERRVLKHCRQSDPLVQSHRDVLRAE